MGKTATYIPAAISHYSTSENIQGVDWGANLCGTIADKIGKQRHPNTRI